MIKNTAKFPFFLLVATISIWVSCATTADKSAALMATAMNTSETNILSKGETVLFTKDIAEDATPAVLARIMMADEKPISTIKFEKGTYHFYPDKGYEVYAYISNHDDVVVHTAMPIWGIDNLTIDGQGSTFIYHGRMIPFMIENCKNIRVQNLSIDWAMPFHGEGLVVANDLEAKTFDLEIKDPYVIKNDQVYFIKEYYEHTFGQTILWDPERKGIAYDTESYTPLTAYNRKVVKRNLDEISYKYKMDKIAPPLKRMEMENRLRMEEIKPGIVRIHNHARKIPKVGLILSGKGAQAGNRVAPAFRITHTDGFKANNVNVHHAGGMGLIAESSADLILDNFNVTPSNGRMVSTTADATHFVGCRGKVVLKNCTFNNQLDDATNVHGSYQVVMDILDDHRIGVRMGHFQQGNFVVGVANDTLGLVRLSDSFFPYDKMTIKSVQKINSRYHIVTLNEKIPAKLRTGDLIENLDAYPELLVENCIISRNRARGVLLSTPKKIVIKDNYFNTEMEPILIPVESGHWYESGSVTNLTVINNTFENALHSGQNRGLIRFVTDDDNENIAFKNIEILDNTFHHFDNLVMEVSNTENLLFKGNTITKSNTFPAKYPENPAFIVESSKNVRFEHNKYQGIAKEMLQSDATVEGLKFE